MNRPFVQSVGLPPEKYADRIVAEMLRYTVAAQTRRWADVQRVLDNRNDGNPRGQAKMVKRLELAGGAFFYDVLLEPGKRGKYTVHVLDVAGWDPAKEEVITEVDAIPSKPWLACMVTKIESKGRHRYDDKSAVALLVTHHAMSRLAQRCGAKEPKDLIWAVHAIWSRYFEVRKNPSISLPDGHRMRVRLGDPWGDCYAVLRKGDKKDYVVTTILGPDGL